jgi:arginyl-tRNA synthetase
VSSQGGPVEELRAAVDRAASAVAGDGRAPKTRPTLERPKQADHGDYATNAAMVLAPVVGGPPREIAQRLGDELAAGLGAAVERVEVAGPGFLNLFLSDDWHAAALASILDAGEAFGGGGADPAQRINIEFVSANPTGPMTAAGGRHGSYGDSLARILAFRGHDVHREYYVNDYGTQVRLLGESIAARARGEAVPEGGYEGDYVAELAEQIPDAATADVDEVARRGVELMLERIRASMHALRVDFDTWFSERSLHEGSPSEVQRAFDVLAGQGRTYESEGALWLRTTEFGDDKDRVLERSTGEHTYFASDIGYHQNKRDRGFDKLINVWGADHHGYQARTQAAWRALDGEDGALELIITQFVHIIERGERSAMSKRRGEFVTLDDLLAEIGVDATRFFMLQRSPDTTVDLDLDLAREQSAENPVYYVQYAHARIASMLAKAGEERVAAALEVVRGGAGVPLHPAERALVKKLLAFPGEVAEAEERRAPHRITVYALELAQDFTAFYRDCRVVGAEPEMLESWRIALSAATQRVIARALDLLGVTAPASM